MLDDTSPRCGVDAETRSDGLLDRTDGVPMATYAGFVKAIANKVAEFTEKRAQAVVRVGARRDTTIIRGATPFERLSVEKTCSCVNGRFRKNSKDQQYR